MNRELFTELAEELGYVKQETLDTRSVEEAAQTFGQEAEMAAIEKYGEMYGMTSSDGGTVVRNEDTERNMMETLERVEDEKRGLTHEDLFVISNIDRIKEIAKEEGRREAAKTTKANPREKRQQARRGTVATRTAGSGMKGEEKIYRPGKDTLEDVINRAGILSQQEHGWR